MPVKVWVGRAGLAAFALVFGITPYFEPAEHECPPGWVVTTTTIGPDRAKDITRCEFRRELQLRSGFPTLVSVLALFLSFAIPAVPHWFGTIHQPSGRLHLNRRTRLILSTISLAMTAIAFSPALFAKPTDTPNMPGCQDSYEKDGRSRYLVSFAEQSGACIHTRYMFDFGAFMERLSPLISLLWAVLVFAWLAIPSLRFGSA